MSKVAVVYWSGTGNTEAMANAVAEAAKAAGADVDMIQAADFSDAAPYDGIAFGCPAMGAEVLEETEFQPMWDAVKGSLGGKKVGLFGSYGWGGGEWMQSWADDARESGVDLVNDGVIANNDPDDDALAQCADLGSAIA
ncbi:MAG: flavodoxin [Lachnospiraceae bacterium]|nr:flavodoxin [Lachnospiraceae bacterium]